MSPGIGFHSPREILTIRIGTEGPRSRSSRSSSARRADSDRSLRTNIGAKRPCDSSSIIKSWPYSVAPSGPTLDSSSTGMERGCGVVDIAESFVLDQERVYVKPAVLPIAVKQHPPTRKKAESVLIEVL